jgi:CRP/FNR family transcriptional regulator
MTEKKEGRNSEKGVKDSLLNLGLEPTLVDEIIDYGRLRKVSTGNALISPDSVLGEIPFVLSGLLRVSRQSENGSEIFLYYLEGGDTCSMSITCCVENTKKSISVVAEEDSRLWMIPGHMLDSWIVKYSGFRTFVFRSYQSRFDELLIALDSVTFMKMDERLFKYLLDKKQASGSFVIQKTHEKIASELNTSRVVISRLLKQMEKEGKIEQGRNRIEIL